MRLDQIQGQMGGRGRGEESKKKKREGEGEIMGRWREESRE